MFNWKKTQILCLGMPYPQNLETAKEVEANVREKGAVPATIAILDGIPCVGVYVILLLLLSGIRCALGWLAYVNCNNLFSWTQNASTNGCK